MNVIELKDLVIEISELTTQNNKKIQQIKFKGKISNDNGFELNKKFHDLINNNYFVILNLSELEYINSTGIAIIFSMFFKCQENKGKLVIGGIHEFIRKVLKIMTLPDGFEIYPTLEEALKSF